MASMPKLYYESSQEHWTSSGSFLKKIFGDYALTPLGTTVLADIDLWCTSIPRDHTQGGMAIYLQSTIMRTKFKMALIGPFFNMLTRDTLYTMATSEISLNVSKLCNRTNSGDPLHYYILVNPAPPDSENAVLYKTTNDAITEAIQPYIESIKSIETKPLTLEKTTLKAACMWCMANTLPLMAQLICNDDPSKFSVFKKMLFNIGSTSLSECYNDITVDLPNPETYIDDILTELEIDVSALATPEIKYDPYKGVFLANNVVCSDKEAGAISFFRTFDISSVHCIFYTSEKVTKTCTQCGTPVCSIETHASLPFSRLDIFSGDRVNVYTDENVSTCTHCMESSQFEISKAFVNLPNTLVFNKTEDGSITLNADYFIHVLSDSESIVTYHLYGIITSNADKYTAYGCSPHGEGDWYKYTNVKRETKNRQATIDDIGNSDIQTLYYYRVTHNQVGNGDRTGFGCLEENPPSTPSPLVSPSKGDGRGTITTVPSPVVPIFSLKGGPADPVADTTGKTKISQKVPSPDFTFREMKVEDVVECDKLYNRHKLDANGNVKEGYSEFDNIKKFLADGSVTSLVLMRTQKIVAFAMIKHDKNNDGDTASLFPDFTMLTVQFVAGNNLLDTGKRGRNKKVIEIKKTTVSNATLVKIILKQTLKRIQESKKLDINSGKIKISLEPMYEDAGDSGIRIPKAVWDFWYSKLAFDKVVYDKQKVPKIIIEDKKNKTATELQITSDPLEYITSEGDAKILLHADLRNVLPKIEVPQNYIVNYKK